MVLVFAVGMGRAASFAAAERLLLLATLLAATAACCFRHCLMLLYGLLLSGVHIPERLAATCYLIWSFLTKSKTYQETRSFRQIDVISIFVMNREDVKVLAK